MTKIDLDKFICSLIDVSIKGGNDGWIHATDIQKTLKEQGLECKNGEIVETSSSKSDFKFEEGKWYTKIDKKEYQPRVADYEDFREWKDEKETTSEYKFKEGDWIIYEDEGLREILKVTAPPDNEYICENLNGENRYLYNKDADDYEFWNINYVKPGDILVWNDSNDLTCIALIKNITYDYLKNEGKVDLWFSYFTDGYWEAWNGGTPYTNVTSLIACDAKPANKRERDLLFQKMKEIGYEFDAENKKFIDKVNYASIINNFKKLMKESKPIPPEVQKVINENFWEML